jgi:hypothetical protein
MGNPGFLFLGEEGRLLFGDAHELINNLLILVVEIIDVLLALEVHGVASPPMHLSQYVFLLHSFATLVPNLLQALEMPPVLELLFYHVKRFSLA